MEHTVSRRIENTGGVSMKKKLILLLLSTALVCMLTACSQEEESDKGVLVWAVPVFVSADTFR